MKRKSLILLAVFFILLLSACRKNDRIQAVIITEAVYESSEGKTIAAVFYSLTDNSLNFVKINYNNKTYTLPQLVSASGSRYSDEFTMEFWTKGSTAYVTTDFGENEKCETYTVK